MHSCGDVTIDGVNVGGITMNQDTDSRVRRYRGPREEHDHAEMTQSHRGEQFSFAGPGNDIDKCSSVCMPRC